MKDGGVLLSVHSDTPEWTSKAKKLLEDSGAKDVSSTGEASSAMPPEAKHATAAQTKTL